MTPWGDADTLPPLTTPPRMLVSPPETIATNSLPVTLSAYLDIVSIFRRFE